MNGPSKATGNFALLINIPAIFNGCGRSLGVTDNGVNVRRGAEAVSRTKALQRLRILKSTRIFFIALFLTRLSPPEIAKVTEATLKLSVADAQSDSVSGEPLHRRSSLAFRRRSDQNLHGNEHNIK